MSKNMVDQIGLGLKRFEKTTFLGLFKYKFKKKSCFILNLGNFYVTLQPELCPGGSYRTVMMDLD